MTVDAHPSVDPGAATDDWKRVFALLDAALELPSDQVAPWLAEVAAGDPTTAATVADLLDRRAAAASDDFLQPPTRTSRSFVGASALRHAQEPAAGGAVGPYRLLEEIGRGGTATVWLAERSDGFVDRRVALKLPDISGPRPPGFAERLDRERRILATLAHPNIARLYDAGIADDGRPYLALEYIAGQPIDVHARLRSLSVRHRVRLLIDVARVVGHAHARLVVHRDLKPSNMLVDASGAVHLLDFGIAKLIDPTLDSPASAQPTLIAGRALTPDYASPEQLRGEAIGTATDLYSLGVVAFELLADCRPPNGDGMRAARPDDDPPLASSATVDPIRRRELRGDLDAIVARLLAPRADDRYVTMEALAEDLERYLARLPVAARKASRGYVLRRWVARHRLETGIGVALLVATAAGDYAQVVVAIAIGVGALLALWQREKALKQARLARAALERSDAVKSFVASIFTQAVPRAGRGGPVAAIDLLKDAARRLETDLAGQPEVTAELSALIGASLNELGDVKAGAQWLPKAVDRCTRAFGATHRLTLQARRRWMEAANTVGDLATVEAQIPSLLADLRAARPPEPRLLVQSLQSQAYMATKHGREQPAMEALSEAIDVALASEGPASATCLSAQTSYSNTLVHFGRFAAALEAIEPAIAPAYALYATGRPHLQLTAVERAHGDALALSGRPRDGAAILRQVLADQRALDVEDTTRVRIATSMLAKALYFGGHFDESAALFSQAADLQMRLTSGPNEETVVAWTWLTLVTASLGRGDDAEAFMERARSATDTHARALSRHAHMVTTHALAAVIRNADDEALTRLAPLLADADRLPDHDRLRAERVRVRALRQRGDLDLAIRHARAAADSLRETVAALEHGCLLVEFARCLRAGGDEAGALHTAHRALEVWDAGQVDGRVPLAALKAEFPVPPPAIPAPAG